MTSPFQDHDPTGINRRSPIVTAGAGMGAGGSFTVDPNSNDNRGLITFDPGGGLGQPGGALFTVAFAVPRDPTRLPKVFLAPQNPATAVLDFTVGSVSQAGFTIVNGNPPPINAWALPGSGVNHTNNQGQPVMVVIAGGTVTQINVGGGAANNTNLTSGCFIVPCGSTIAVTYSVAPTTYLVLPTQPRNPQANTAGGTFALAWLAID